MKHAMRFIIAAIVGVTSFFATVVGFEFIAWWWTAPVDLLSDPAINAVRFAAALAVGLGTAFMVYPRIAAPVHPRIDG